MHPRSAARAAFMYATPGQMRHKICNAFSGVVTSQGGAECPHLPFGLCPRVWDAAHVPERLTDDAAIYGDPFLAGRAHWPLWLLAAAALAALSAATSETAGQAAGGGLLGHAAACGGCVGAYLALELFPGQNLMQVLWTSSRRWQASCSQRGLGLSEGNFGRLHLA